MTKKAQRFALAATLVLSAAAALLIHSGLRTRPGLAEQIEATAAPSRTDGVLEIVLLAERGALRPNVIYAAAGSPLRLVVRAGPDGPERVVVSGLGVSARLAPGGETAITIPAPPRGDFGVTDGAGKPLGVLAFQ